MSTICTCQRVIDILIKFSKSSAWNNVLQDGNVRVLLLLLLLFINNLGKNSEHSTAHTHTHIHTHMYICVCVFKSKSFFLFFVVGSKREKIKYKYFKINRSKFLKKFKSLGEPFHFAISIYLSIYYTYTNEKQRCNILNHDADIVLDTVYVWGLSTVDTFFIFESVHVLICIWNHLL